MQTTITLMVIVLYFGILLWVSHWVSAKKENDNATFFQANRQSKWWLVAFGMIGTSISGVSFVSVPGWVTATHFNYLQMVLGFFFGYIFIARVLLPIYYKLNLISIYTYLQKRFGNRGYKTGAFFFIVSKIIGAGVRLYLVALILQKTLFDTWNIPFYLSVALLVLLIWLYTRRSGIKTVVFTDTIQTFVLLTALVLIVVKTVQLIELPFNDIIHQLAKSPNTDIFVFNDWQSKQFFWKQFLSGMFIPIVMTGLDQDQMQKNLTCRNLKEAQKNMYWYGMAFLPINFIFLTLGALLLILAQQNGIILPTKSDEILPFFAANYLGNGVFLLFIIGIVAATFSSADSALTSLTTSFSIDILEINKIKDKKKSNKLRKQIHFLLSILFIFVIIFIDKFNKTNIIDTIYTIVGYTYGSLLGLYAFGLFTKMKTNDKTIPYIAIVAPIICFILNFLSTTFLNYSLGYELLILNGSITFIGLWFFRIKKQNTNTP